jgi:hypothetical protein
MVVVIKSSFPSAVDATIIAISPLLTRQAIDRQHHWLAARSASILE